MQSTQVTDKTTHIKEKDTKKPLSKEQRLAVALRANLKRRKQQQRERESIEEKTLKEKESCETLIEETPDRQEDQ